MTDMQENPDYPIKDYKLSTFTFTREEQSKMVTFDSISQLGKLADIMKDNVLKSIALPRLGVKPLLDTGIMYNLSTGTIYVYIPRVLCDICHNRKAVYDKETKKYCQDCMDKLTEKKV